MACASLVGVLALSGGEARANLVLNSSFEDDGFNQGSALFCPIGSWTAVCDGKTGETQTLDPVLVGRSSYLAIGTVGGLGFVSQTLSTVAGQLYAFTFDYSSDGDAGNRFQAIWDGNVLMDVAGDAFNPGWASFDGSATYSFLVTATTASTTISLGGQGASNSFIGVDDVSVAVAVPEPSTLALLGLGLLAWAASRRGSSPA